MDQFSIFPIFGLTIISGLLVLVVRRKSKNYT
ncbi:MAG: LPXTG cell wall anchor domain-containing protein [Candidatus Kariarchaeaceae archaeon]